MLCARKQVCAGAIENITQLAETLLYMTGGDVADTALLSVPILIANLLLAPRVYKGVFPTELTCMRGSAFISAALSSHTLDPAAFNMHKLALLQDQDANVLCDPVTCHEP